LRPSADDRDGPLVALLLLLTFLTGLVDAVSYLKLGHVFVANMTGNVVFLGFAIAGARGLSTVSSLLAVGAFLIGALLGGRLGVRYAGQRGRLLQAANVAQVPLMAAALLLALSAGEPSRDLSYVLTVLLACAMGVQNACARRLAVADLTTTVLTLTLTGIAADSRGAGGPGARLARRGAAVVTMALGALTGALLVLNVSLAAPLAMALALVLTSGITVGLLARGGAPWTRG
jgi:uncharacterized membrane protein YoaK (UPF0700 family)